MAQKGPGKAHRQGISLMELTEMFPDEQSAVRWFEALVWPNGERTCPRCGSMETREASKSSGLPYYCPACKRAFSVRIGTALERSKVPLRKWVFAIYLEMTSLKGVSSMKLHRDIGVTQKTAWFMLHRIREAWANGSAWRFAGPVEADETFIGGKRKNMPLSKRKAMGKAGRGAVGKAVVAGVKDRDSNRISADVVRGTDALSLQGFVLDRVMADAKLYTDESRSYNGIKLDREAVNHSVSEYVRGQAHTNGIESFWAMLKRGYHGTYHHISEKHLHRYVAEFAGRHNVRNCDTIDQMISVVIGMVGKRLMYRDLIAEPEEESIEDWIERETVRVHGG
ncbi:MAG: IS1595 family transposase [Deltaproteobacteria bacterium]|nr:IS1595 family transposase [Deltaproteobacteria bacterium]